MNMSPIVLPANKYDCQCGRSPNGKCLGWHKLTEEQYKARLFLYREKVKNVQRNFVTLALQLYHQDKYKISGFNKRSPETSST